MKAPLVAIAGAATVLVSAQASPPRQGSASAPRAVISGPLLLGRSEDGRPIVALRVGDARAIRVLVFGCIHGNECAGIAIARALQHVRGHVDLWIVPNLNPDGFGRG
jgi:predicted deacylase